MWHNVIFVNNGDYAFQNYAVTHWSDHFAAAITDSTADPPAAALPGIQNDLVSALTNFVAAYGLTPDSSALEDYGRKSGIVHGMKLHSRFLDRSCYEDVLAILHLLQGQSAKGLDGLDEISPLPLDRAVHTSRAVLEGLASADAVALQQEERQKLVCFYGKNWFKCSKAACFYFHEGFPDARSRKSHIDRHERPFRCTDVSCETGFKLGSVKKKDLEKHLGVYHPENGQMKVRIRSNERHAC